VDFSETQITRCSHRIVKDGADDEREHWWRLSARRAFDAAARSQHIGLRIMRTFDLTARNGF
jgi:formylglycine-generating enzyme required for sulfatase activity